MIAFGCAITDPELYRRYAERGILLAREHDSLVLAHAAPRSVVGTYNLTLERAAGRGDLEALVLLDQRAEILDTDFCAKIRRALNDPDVAVVGCAGAANVRSIAWWEGTRAFASSVYRSEEDGAELPGLLPDGWTARGEDHDSHPGEVDAVDGVLMVLAPWAVRNVQFDESLGPGYGYDVDYCLQVRSADRKVVTADLKVAHCYPLGVLDDPDTWMEAYMRAAEKWEGRLPSGINPGSDWEHRARRAEGEAATARLLAASKMYEAQALAWHQERELARATSSASWRLTAPLRRLNAIRKGLR